jgi:hypothetical protein
MASYEPVQRVREWRRSDGSQHPAERAGQPDLDEERHAPSAVAGNQCAVTEDEPPALAALVFGHGRKQKARVVIGEREQGQLIASVEPGDEPRRPAAKPSATGIEQNRARKGGGRRSGVHVLCHSSDYATSSSGVARTREPARWSATTGRVHQLADVVLMENGLQTVTTTGSTMRCQGRESGWIEPRSSPVQVRLAP